MEHRTAEFDGKRIAFTDQTEFLVEVGRYAKGAYKTRYRFVGSLIQALQYYQAINIGRGYKKRLRAPSLNKPILARAAS